MAGGEALVLISVPEELNVQGFRYQKNINNIYIIGHDLEGKCIDYLSLQSKNILQVLKILSHLGEGRNEFIKYSGS